jgi:hypothetical protein
MRTSQNEYPPFATVCTSICNELRDGSGIGVGAPQFGQRRGFYGTVAYDF